MDEPKIGMDCCPCTSTAVPRLRLQENSEYNLTVTIKFQCALHVSAILTAETRGTLWNLIVKVDYE